MPPSTFLNIKQHTPTIGAWKWMLEDDSMLWSQEIFEILGLDSTTFIPTFSTFITRIHPQDENQFLEAIETTVSNNTLLNIHVKIKTAMDNYLTIELQATLDNQNNIMEGTFHNINELTQCQHALVKTKKLFETSQEISHIASWEWDLYNNSFTFSHLFY